MYGDDAEVLTARIHEVEHRLCPRRSASSRPGGCGGIRIDRRRVQIIPGEGGREGHVVRSSRSPTRPASSTSPRAWPALGVEIVSTGGTATALRDGGHRGADGRRVHRARRRSSAAGSRRCTRGCTRRCSPPRRPRARGDARRREGIEPIDLVCVNLYPFEQTVGPARRRPTTRRSRTSTSAGRR